MEHGDEQTILYRGPVRLGFGPVVLCSVCVLFLAIAVFFPLLLLAAGPVAILGLPAVMYSWLLARRTVLVITDSGIRLETGLIVRSTEVVDFVRVQDVALSRVFGWETLVLHGSDVRTPQISLCFPGAAGQFEPIRSAIARARRDVVAVQHL